jgi:hypothetical protein
MNEQHASFVAAATGVMGRSDGTAALRELAWTPELKVGDADAMAMLGALFEAQGRTLAVTPALGSLVAAAYCGGDSLQRVAAIEARPIAGRPALALIGPPLDGIDEVVVDRGPEGLFVCSGPFEPAAGVAGFDAGATTRVVVATSSLERVALAPSELDGRRETAHALARVAIAHEVLGACETVHAMAVDYARDRMQFGVAIGSFQAVQHLLARAEAGLGALRAACAVARTNPSFVEGSAGLDPLLLKGLAARVGREVTQSSLQVLGAIGFTWEHPHHRYLRRVLTLEACYGSLAWCREEIGRRTAGGQLWRTPCFAGVAPLATR